LTLIDDLTKELDERLGAIGDMHFVVKEARLDDDCLVIGGDNLFDEDLHGFLSFAKTHSPHPTIGVYDILHKEHASKYGVVKLDAHHRVIDFQEKPKVPESTFIAMCLYYFPRQRLGLIREYMESKTDKQDATGFYIDWLRKREKVRIHIQEGGMT
jgi:glucose-1-phosphate thymidylyltransferase